MGSIDMAERVRVRNGWAVEGDHVVVPLPSGRRQAVHTETIDDDGRTFLRLTAVVGEASRLGDVRLRAALTLNAELHTGAIAISGDSLVLTDSFPVSSVDVDTLDAAMRFLAATADQYEGILFGTDAN